MAELEELWANAPAYADIVPNINFREDDVIMAAAHDDETRQGDVDAISPPLDPQIKFFDLDADVVSRIIPTGIKTSSPHRSVVPLIHTKCKY